MNQTSLKSRILSLVLSTLFFLVVLAGIQIRERLHRLNAAKEVSKSLSYYIVTSAAVHEMQKERGKSSLFLNGKTDEADLKNQQQVATQKRELILPAAEELGSGFYSVIQELLHKHDELRKAVLSKSLNASESTEQFSNLIATLINEQSKVAKLHKFEGLESLLTSQTIFESSKEYTGIMRATVNGVLGNDEPISADLEKKIMYLKIAMINSLNSKGVTFGEETIQQVTRILSTDEWKFVDNALTVIQNKAREGKYGINAADFSKNITACIDAIFKILSEQTVITKNTIESVIVQETKVFWTYLVSLGLLIIISLGVSLTLTARLNKEFEEIVRKLDSGIQVIVSSSKELASSSSLLSSSSTEQAASLEETVSSIEEISSMVTLNSTHANESAKLSGISQQQAKSGEEMMTNLVSVMNEISEASKKIQDITSVIDDIAFQTNLLALNAAVEAARAGEQGKGFAVVADAVRSLAQRSAEAAKDISAMISGSVGKIQSGVDVVQKNSGLLHEIVGSISKVSSINSDIASSSQDQSTGLQQVNQAMNLLDQATQSNASAAEILAQTSNSMEEQVENFQKIFISLKAIIEGQSKAS